VLQCVAVCCSVLQCVAVCCSVLQYVAVCCSVLQCVAVCCSALQYVAVCCSALLFVAMRCSVLQCILFHLDWHALNSLPPPPPTHFSPFPFCQGNAENAREFGHDSVWMPTDYFHRNVHSVDLGEKGQGPDESHHTSGAFFKSALSPFFVRFCVNAYR